MPAVMDHEIAAGCHGRTGQVGREMEVGGQRSELGRQFLVTHGEHDMEGLAAERVDGGADDDDGIEGIERCSFPVVARISGIDPDEGFVAAEILDPCGQFSIAALPGDGTDVTGGGVGDGVGLWSAHDQGEITGHEINAAGKAMLASNAIDDGDGAAQRGGPRPLPPFEAIACRMEVSLVDGDEWDFKDAGCEAGGQIEGVDDDIGSEVLEQLDVQGGHGAHEIFVGEDGGEHFVDVVSLAGASHVRTGFGQRKVGHGDRVQSRLGNEGHGRGRGIEDADFVTAIGQHTSNRQHARG